MTTIDDSLKDVKPIHYKFVADLGYIKVYDSPTERVFLTETNGLYETGLMYRTGQFEEP